MKRIIHFLTVVTRVSVLVAALGAAAASAQATVALDSERAARVDDALTSTDVVTALGGFSRAMVLFRHDPDPSVERRFLLDAAERARSAVVRAHASLVLARRQARAGELDAAALRMLALGLVPSMRVLGPFTNTGGAELGQPLPVDDSAVLASSQESRVPGRARDVGWQTVPLSSFGEFDLDQRLTALQESRVVFAVAVRAPTARAAALRLGSSGQIRALLNGVEVARVDADRPARLDQTVAGVQLVRGENLLVLEAGFLGDEARVLARLTDPGGTAWSDLAYATDAASLKRAAQTRPSSLPPPVVVDPVARARDASARAAESGDVAALRAAVDVEQRLRTGDRRARPRTLEVWLEGLTRLLASMPSSESHAAEWRRERALARARLGDELFARQDVSGARRAWEEALADDPDCVDALLGLADLRDDQGDADRARELLARARAALPESDLVARRALELERRSRSDSLDVMHAIFDRARAAPTEENVALAADVHEERRDLASALEVLSTGSDAQRKLRLRMRQHAARGADVPLSERRALAFEAVRLRPENHGFAETYALTCAEDGRMDEARAFVLARMRDFPERPEPHLLAARLALVGADRGAARAALQAALAIVPQDAEVRRTLRALEGDTDDLVARYGIEPRVPKDAPTDALTEQARSVGVHLEDSVVAARFFDNGLGRTLTDKLFVVHDAQKGAGLQVLSFPYSPGREELDVLIAERITRDGVREPAARIVDQGPGGKENGAYSDVATKNIVFGQLADGDRIHVRTRKQLVGEQNLFGDFFGLMEPLQSTIPIRRLKVVVEAPTARPLAWGGRGVPEPTVREDGDRRVYEFIVQDKPGVVPEPGMPPFTEAVDLLSVSTYGSWEEMGRWYEALIAPQLIMNDELKSVVQTLVRDAPTEAERVRRIYEYVVTSTRYVGIELGIHGWKPYPVTEVHRRRYGDCKDKASLLVAMLREAGVAANIALVRTANAGTIASDPPSMWMFNHAIAYVPGLDVFLDGTAEQSGWRELPVMDQGALTLIVGAHGEHRASRLRTIPIKPSDDNLNVSEYVLTLGRDGALLVRGQERFRGAHNAENRRDFSDPARWRERLERQLAAIMPGARVGRIDVRDLSLAAEETGYQFEATLPERGVRESSGSWVMALSLYPHDLVGNYAQASTRQTATFIDRPWRTHNVMRYVLPSHLRVVELPTGGSVDSEHIRFQQRVTRTEDGFIVDEDTAVLSRRIPPEDYAAFRDAALRADALMKRKVRLMETQGAGAGGTP